MTEQQWDVVVLGGGTGGYVAAIRAAQLGLKVVLVERDQVGGTCLHWGCIPTKVLLQSAEVLHTVRGSEQFGVRAGAAELDFARVSRRRRQVVGRLHKGVSHLLQQAGVHVLQGKGTLLPPSIFAPSGAVSVDTPDGGRELLSPRQIILATGSRPRPLPGLPFDGERVLSSDHAVTLERVPATVVIVGAGAIGVEFASLWNDFGSRVTLVELEEQVLPREDPEVAAEVARALQKRGVEVRTGLGVLPETLQVAADGLAIEAAGRAGRVRLTGEALLVAIGRQPNSDGIGLENNDKIKTEGGWVVVNERLQTGDPDVYAIGDLTGRLLLAHTAAHDGICAAEAIAGRQPHPYAVEAVPRIVFSRPQVAALGLTEAEAARAGHRLKIGRFPFRANGKALIGGDTAGFVKVIAAADGGDLLGMHMVGPHVTELAGEAALAKLLDATPWEIGLAVHPHPTLVEVLGEAALAVDGRAIHIASAAPAADREAETLKRGVLR